MGEMMAGVRGKRADTLCVRWAAETPLRARRTHEQRSTGRQGCSCRDARCGNLGLASNALPTLTPRHAPTFTGMWEMMTNEHGIVAPSLVAGMCMMMPMAIHTSTTTCT